MALGDGITSLGHTVVACSDIAHAQGFPSAEAARKFNGSPLWEVIEVVPSITYDAKYPLSMKIDMAESFTRAYANHELFAVRQAMIIINDFISEFKNRRMPEWKS